MLDSAHEAIYNTKGLSAREASCGVGGDWRRKLAPAVLYSSYLVLSYGCSCLVGHSVPVASVITSPLVTFLKHLVTGQAIMLRIFNDSKPHTSQLKVGFDTQEGSELTVTNPICLSQGIKKPALRCLSPAHHGPKWAGPISLVPLSIDRQWYLNINQPNHFHDQPELGFCINLNERLSIVNPVSHDYASCKPRSMSVLLGSNACQGDAL